MMFKIPHLGFKSRTKKIQNYGSKGYLETDKKENKFPHKYGNSEGSGAKSSMTNGLLIYGEIFAHCLIC
jgi:hypothetical protein